MQRYRAHLLKLDIIFPLICGTLVLSLIACVTRGGSEPQRWVLILFSLPLAGVAFDLAENGLHIWILKDVVTLEDLNDISLGLIRLSFVCTVLKYALLLVPPLLAIGAGLIRRLSRRRGAGNSAG